MGGVEQHMFSLAQTLSKKGHKIIVLTIAWDYQNLSGVRYITDNIKVYYLPILSMLSKPFYLSHMSLCGPFSILIRNILLNEQIQLVHGHQQTSTLSINVMNIVYPMNLPFVLSQHSLHDTDGFADNLISSIYCTFNKLIVDKIICVSNIV